ncbi:thiolase family protein [Pseudonocardia sp. EV170527-09]|uniref:thiolase family protein n=1 Tax=Pseudonocardia sp. EV170527-09 TaxID=2603411 RepID=UPI0011F2AC61|nr:thiolase family protein [Pseudonocardia sp. EV170527-09]KAA1029457.1 thiolase family protein [Pseudonocardia sp. EV170527-09]
MTVPGSDTPADTPVVVAARRTPIGTAGGALRAVTVDALAAPVLAALAGALGGPVDDVLLGNVFGPGGNPARVAALAAGLGDEVPGMTVDRQCASGLAAILTAAAGIRAGDGIGYLAGGAESPSTAPTRTWADGTVYTRAPFAPAGDPDPDMGPAADDAAARAGLPRTRLDAFAARSHARAVDAQRAGRFDDELVPVDGVGGPLTADERPRDRYTADRLARFRPAFTPDGVHTAANSCGVNDGAAAVALVPEWRRRELGVPGLALVSAATRGCPPADLGLGAVPALAALRDRPTAPDAVEFTEAFAGQALACLDAAGIDEHLAGQDGGAIALGHPWGASGAVLVVRLFHRLVVQGSGETGIAALSSGGGLGVATSWRVVR